MSSTNERNTFSYVYVENCKKFLRENLFLFFKPRIDITILITYFPIKARTNDTQLCDSINKGCEEVSSQVFS